jgi:hypothetical protein
MGGFTPRTVSVGIWRGSITVRVALQPKNHDEEIFGKMKRIAKKLGAKVIGDGAKKASARKLEKIESVCFRVILFRESIHVFPSRASEKFA